MSWGLAFALGMAALLALATTLRNGLTRLQAFEERVLSGRGLSPSLLIAYPMTKDAGRCVV